MFESYHHFQSVYFSGAMANLVEKQYYDEYSTITKRAVLIYLVAASNAIDQLHVTVSPLQKPHTGLTRIPYFVAAITTCSYVSSCNCVLVGRKL